MKNLIFNQRGLTLIELIASITILSIVIITFLGFFTNAFRFNTINSDHMQATNIAREQQALIKEDQKVKDLLDNKLLPANANVIIEGNNYLRELTSGDYDVKIYIGKEPQKNNNWPTTYLDLYLVHIEVLQNNKLLSETYTYLESEKED